MEPGRRGRPGLVSTGIPSEILPCPGLKVLRSLAGVIPGLPMPFPSLPSSSRLRRRILLGGLALLLGWLAFFDSHSLLQRGRYAYELNRLSAENERLQAENSALSQHIRSGLSNATVERVAREQYGMRRPGETVYRIETDD